MSYLWLEYIFIFITTLVFIRLLRQYADALGLIDIPNLRSTHISATPRGAGIAFFFSIIMASLIFHYDFMLSYLWVYLAMLMVYIVGILDDRHDAPPKAKFIVLAMAALLITFNDIIIEDVGLFFGYHVHLGYLALPFTIFAVVGFSNALNLIDGLDGLAGTISLVILAAYGWIGWIYNDTFIFTLSVTFIVSLLAFLLYNWYPASIFMGDSGSLTLGFVIAVLSIKALEYLPAVSVLFIAAIPLLDTLIVMIRRKRNRKSMFSADKLHIHHLLLLFFGNNVQKTVIAIVLLQGIYTLTGLQMEKEANQVWSLVLFVLNVVLWYIVLNRMVTRQRSKHFKIKNDTH